MVDKKLSELTELAAAAANDDEVYIRDVSEAESNESKRITIANLLALYLALAGGTTTGPIKIGDATYIQIGHSVGSAQLTPHLEATAAGFLLKPSAGNRIGYLAMQPKGTEDRTQISMYNREQSSDTSVFSIEVNGDTVTILFEDVGTPLTSIAHVNVQNIWSFQSIKPINNLLSSIGTSSKKWLDLYVEHHHITQNLASDHKWAGTTAPMTAGINLVLPQAVYVGGDGKMEKVLATGAGTMPAIALAVRNINEDAEGEFLLQGFFRDDTWGWTPGGLLYASRGTAGALTQTQPATAGDQVQVVGIAITADIIHFNPSYELVEVSA